MYLNLDLLYNVNDFSFPLFYYKLENFYNIYSPMNKKSVSIKNEIWDEYYDYSTSYTMYLNTGSIYTFIPDISLKNYTENQYTYGPNIYDRCSPIKIKSEYLEYLKNNKRLSIKQRFF